MSRSKLFLHSILNSAGVVAYVAAVAWVLIHFQLIFGEEPGVWAIVGLLILFVLSATIVGLLILGRPAYMYVNGLRTEAIKLLVYTVGFLIIILLLIVLVVLR